MDLRFTKEMGNKVQVSPMVSPSNAKRLGRRVRELREDEGIKPQLKGKVGHRSLAANVGHTHY